MPRHHETQGRRAETLTPPAGRALRGRTRKAIAAVMTAPDRTVVAITGAAIRHDPNSPCNGTA